MGTAPEYNDCGGNILSFLGYNKPFAFQKSQGSLWIITVPTMDLASVCMTVCCCGNWQMHVYVLALTSFSSRWLELSCIKETLFCWKWKTIKYMKQTKEGGNCQLYPAWAVLPLRCLNVRGRMREMIHRHSPAISRTCPSHLSEVFLMSQTWCQRPHFHLAKCPLKIDKQKTKTVLGRESCSKMSRLFVRWHFLSHVKTLKGNLLANRVTLLLCFRHMMRG